MLQNIRITTRSVIFFGLLGFITLILGVFALNQLQLLTRNSQQLGELRLPQVTDVGVLRREFLLNQLYVARLATASTAEQVKSTNDRIAALFISFDKALEPVVKLAQS